MENDNFPEGNLVSLSEWKVKKQNCDFSQHLRILSFSDLMRESEDLAKEISGPNPSEDIFAKTKIIMNEFAHRLEKKSKSLSNTVKDLKKSIEEKLH